MKAQYFLLFLGFAILSGSCSKTKSLSTDIPETPYNINDESVININFDINKKALLDTLSMIVDESFADEMDFPDYEVRAKLTRQGDISLDVDGRDVLIILPLKADVVKETFLGDIKANGVVELSFSTNFDISENWKLSTKTKFQDYLWIVKPNINMGAGSFPIEGMADRIFEEVQPLLEQELDNILSEQTDLKSNIDELTKTLTEPKQLSDDYGGWFYFQPQGSSLSGLTNKQHSITGKIALITKTIVQSSKPKGEIRVENPIFKWDENISDMSIFRINTFIQYEHLEDQIRPEVVGKTFEQKGKQVTIDDIKMYGRKQKMVIESKVHGDLNGVIVLEGKPKYDRESKNIYVDNIDFKVKSSNLAHRALAWVLKGKIRNELEKLMVFPLDDAKNDLQDAINVITDDYAETYNLDFRINVEDIGIGYVSPLENTLSTQFLIDNRIFIYFKDLSLFTPE